MANASASLDRIEVVNVVVEVVVADSSCDKVPLQQMGPSADE